MYLIMLVQKNTGKRVDGIWLKFYTAKTFKWKEMYFQRTIIFPSLILQLSSLIIHQHLKYWLSGVNVFSDISPKLNTVVETSKQKCLSNNQNSTVLSFWIIFVDIVSWYLFIERIKLLKEYDYTCNFVQWKRFAWEVQWSKAIISSNDMATFI
jgi:hypothetical protein